MRIGIVGGTGPAGTAVAARLASLGHEMVIGSRSIERAAEVRDEVVKAWPTRDLQIGAADNRGAASCDLVFLATPWDGAEDTVRELRAELNGKVLISMANALARLGKVFQPLTLPRGSVAVSLQSLLPGTRVCAALHHIPAHELGDLDSEIDSDVLICGDDPGARSVTTELLAPIPGVRILDVGSLANALPIEAFTAVLLQLNVRYKTRVALRFTGIPGPEDRA
jgi:NADPH-dependent F420 reductase